MPLGYTKSQGKTPQINKSSNQQSMKIKSEIIFVVHLMVTVLAWIAPFLFTWWMVALALGAVMLQFLLFGRCLMNRHHDLGEDDHTTFYSYLLERIGFRPDRPRLKVFVRRYLYPILTAIACLWQVGLGFKPVFF